MSSCHTNANGGGCSGYQRQTCRNCFRQYCNGKKLNEVIACYKKCHRVPDENGKMEDAWMWLCADYGKKGDMENAIRVAATGHLCGLVKHCGGRNDCINPHQRRPWDFWPSAFREFTDELLKKQGRLEAAQDFKEIHAIVLAAAARITGIGSLAVYDASIRIACALGKETMPKKFFPREVYVDTGSGPPRGLENFIKKKAAKNKEELFTIFMQNGLVPAEIENLLCICKDAM